ncbi:hypothetical protein F2Q68_00008986 [Brassica cretica]|uniref:Uncharacterized protein n=1 Tax=Brassica cretica TaxID=69181 RepID=A0A8S9KUP2_BRACR|nr:hypothetical protein F2Q68_00008986 [Brassica cretica]
MTSRKSSRGLPGSRLTESSPLSLPFITGLGVLVFNQIVLIFHSFKGFSDLDLICKFFTYEFDMQVFQIWKTSGTTYLRLPRRSSRPFRLVLQLIFNLDDLQVFITWFSSSTHLKMTSRKSSRGLPGSRLTEFSPLSLPFITGLGVLVFNQIVLIFHSFKGFSDLEDFWDDLPVSRLKYNALDDF